MNLSLVTAAALCTSASEAVLCLTLDLDVRDAVLIAATLSLCGYCLSEVLHALSDAHYCGLVDG